MYADGGGLYLQIAASGSKSWSFRFMLNGRAREMGLGPASLVSLAEAREKAEECRRQRLNGIDPIDARNAERQQALAPPPAVMTFSECATAYVEAHEAGWRNPKHVQQWKNTLKTYVDPVFGALDVQSVDLALVMKVLEPIWRTKAETASRLRGRIETILDWATVRGFRQGENPARWRGHLETLLPQRAKVQKVEHHAALPYPEIAAFMTSLRRQKGVGAKAFQFLILTAARTSEALGATWQEIDLAAKQWVVPADRIKAGKEHRVPLSSGAVQLLKTLREDLKTLGLGVEPTACVFPGGRTGKPLSNMALLSVLKRMERTDLTAHGFRSTFRDWAAEQTNFPHEVAEMALAHAVGNKVEAAYRRGDLLEKRREIMQSWFDYCSH